jgi:hypothetical protein
LGGHFFAQTEAMAQPGKAEAKKGPQAGEEASGHTHDGWVLLYDFKQREKRKAIVRAVLLYGFCVSRNRKAERL